MAIEDTYLLIIQLMITWIVGEMQIPDFGFGAALLPGWSCRNRIRESNLSELKPCPRCGTKAYISRDVVDGFYFGWSASCPRYCHYDGIHGTTIDTSEKDCYAVHGASSKEEAMETWNNRVEHLKELDQQIGCEKIFEEMQRNQLR